MASKSKPSKIAIFHCGFIYSGGGERIVLEEARELKKRGYDVEVYAPTVDCVNCFPELIHELKVKMFLPSLFGKLPLRNAMRMVASSFLAPLLAIKFRDVDLFIGANQPGAWIAFCMGIILRKPYMVYLNQPNRIVYPRPVDVEYGWYTSVKDYHFLYRLLRITRPLLLHLDKQSVQQADAIFVNGGYIGSIIENIYARPVINAPAGSFVYDLPEKRSKPKIQYLLITNRHDPQKRFDYVISMLPRVLKKYKKVKLMIPGPFTEHTKNLVNLTKKLGIEHKVKFMGKVSEEKLQELYRDASVYCYPSPHEDFGLGPLEAGGWGVPTVAWNHAGPTVTVENGVTGLLAEPYDLDDYAEKVLKLLKDKNLREKMGKNAYRRTKELFSWRRHVDILEREIKSLLKR